MFLLIMIKTLSYGELCESYFFPLELQVQVWSSFGTLVRLRHGFEVLQITVANLVGDGMKQELLSAATLNSTLDMAVQSSCKFSDMLHTYKTLYVVTQTELKPHVSLVSRFSSLWIEDPHKIAAKMLYMYTHKLLACTTIC